MSKTIGNGLWARSVVVVVYSVANAIRTVVDRDENASSLPTGSKPYRTAEVIPCLRVFFLGSSLPLCLRLKEPLEWDVLARPVR